MRSTVICATAEVAGIHPPIGVLHVARVRHARRRLARVRLHKRISSQLVRRTFPVRSRLRGALCDGFDKIFGLHRRTSLLLDDDLTSAAAALYSRARSARRAARGTTLLRGICAVRARRATRTSITFAVGVRARVRSLISILLLLHNTRDRHRRGQLIISDHGVIQGRTHARQLATRHLT